MYEFFFDSSEKRVYMTLGAGKARTSLRGTDNEIVEWNTLPTRVLKAMRPLCVSKKMVENEWESHYYQELPYDEMWDFMEWLKLHFNASNCALIIGNVRVHISRTYNEVHEPYLDCSAPIAKDVLVQVMSVIVDEYIACND